MRHFFLYAVISLSLAGCAAVPIETSFDYSKPTSSESANEITIEASFNEAWDKLVREMSKSFYVINNIDKESRLINISFTINDNISDFVDCGESKRSFVMGKFIDNITYKTADKSEYLVGSTSQQFAPNTVYFKIYRRPTLSGRANVYIAPEGNRTRISVNTRYIWNVKLSEEGHLYAPLGNKHSLLVAKRPLTSEPSPISFNTKNVGLGDSMSCVSTYKFEREILSILR